MASVMKEFEHLKIHLEEIKKATNNFSSKVIGKGGFGKVYEGEVSHSKGRSIVAIKRLNREFGQGDPEFMKELMMLSRYAHTNLVSLLGYCDEKGEKILVYEHVSNGSLDRHIGSTVLTWTQRLKICLDVARGLTYLHDHKGTQQRVLHRDIKSANILLDENWNAKLADMGLSKIGPANQQHTVLFTNLVGTPGYCDPQYMLTYALTKESDIYSFGVVLFEVLCGRLCYKWSGNQLKILVPMWKNSYTNKKLNQIIFKDLIPSMDPTSLRTFSEIAFQCLHDSREERPTTSLLVKKLQTALVFQEHHELKLDDVVGTSHTYLNTLFSKGKGLFVGKKNKEVDTQKKAEWSGGKREEKLIRFDDTHCIENGDVRVDRKSDFKQQAKALAEALGRTNFEERQKLQTALKFQEHHEMKLDDAVGTSHTYLNTLFSKGKGLFVGKKNKEVATQKKAEWSGRKRERTRICFDDTQKAELMKQSSENEKIANMVANSVRNKVAQQNNKEVATQKKAEWSGRKRERTRICLDDTQKAELMKQSSKNEKIANMVANSVKNKVAQRNSQFTTDTQ